MRGVFTLLRRSVQSYREDSCSIYSAAVAYYTVFAIFPIALVGVAILGAFIGDAAARGQVVEAITSVVTLGPEGTTALADTLEGVSRARGLVGFFGLLFSLWSAVRVFTAIRTALDDVWGITGGPALRAKAQDLMLFFGFSSLLLASTVFSSLVAGWWKAHGGRFGSLEGIAFAIPFLIVLLTPLTFAAFLFLHRFGTRARVHWGDVWPAALITAFFFEFGKALFTYYISNFGTYNAVIGSLGAAILLLLWVNYSANVTLLAAEIAKHRKLVRAGELPRVDPPNRTPQQSLYNRVREAALRLWIEDEATAVPPRPDPEPLPRPREAEQGQRA